MYWILNTIFNTLYVLSIVIITALNIDVLSIGYPAHYYNENCVEYWNVECVLMISVGFYCFVTSRLSVVIT